MKLIYLCLMFVLTMTFSLSAQSCTVTCDGVILDKATREPLDFTTIAIPDQGLSVMSDTAGRFVLTNICPGKFHIKLFHVGCPETDAYVEILHDTTLTFYLEHHPELLREIEVVSQGDVLEESSIQQTLSSSQLRNRTGQSVAELISGISGVTMLRNGSGISKPVIHGLNGNRIAVVNNGLVQAGQQWGADHAPEIDPTAANHITVIKGSDAIEYGTQALAGVVLVEPGLIPKDPHFHGFAGYGFAANGRSQTLFGKLYKTYNQFSVRLTGSAKKSGDTQTPEYFLTNTGLRESNASVELQYQPSLNTTHRLYYSLFTADLGIFSGSHISNLSDLETALYQQIPFNIDSAFSYHIAPPKQKVEHQLIKYAGRHFYADSRSVEWVYGAQYNHRREFDIRRGNRSGIPALDLGQWVHDVQVKFSGGKDQLNWKYGTQFRYIFNRNQPDTGILPLIPNYQQSDAGFFASLQQTKNIFTWEGGLRYDLHLLQASIITVTTPKEVVEKNHVFQDAAITLGLSMQPGTAHKVRWQIAAARRSPAVNELYSNGLHQGIAGIEEGDSNLKPESSLKGILNWQTSADHFFHADLTVYGHLIADYIYLQAEPDLRLTIRGAFPVYTYQQSNGWIRGLDFLLASDFSHRLQWITKLSWVRGTLTEQSRNLPLMPPVNIRNALQLNIGESSKLTGCTFSLEADYTARQEHWDATTEIVSPPDAYWLINFTSNAGIKLNGNVVWLHFSIENLTQKTYRSYLNRLRFFADEQGIQCRLSMRYEF